MSRPRSYEELSAQIDDGAADPAIMEADVKFRRAVYLAVDAKNIQNRRRTRAAMREAAAELVHLMDAAVGPLRVVK